MPESSSSASPGVPPPYKLTQDKGGTNFTLKIDEGVTTIKAGEFAAVPSIGSGADKKTLNTKITRQALGLKTDGEVHTAVTTIILPSTLETIEDYAFYGHTAVKGTLIIPDKVHTIGAHAFGKTGTALTLDLKDDSKLNSIGAGAFDITSIAKIQAPRFTLTKNADNTTYTFAVAEGVTTAARGEFSSQESTGGSPPITLNTKLKGVLLGTDPQNAITAITLPSTLVKVEDYAFYGHTAVKGTLIIPDKVQSIGASAFGKTGTALTLDLKDDSKLDTIGAGAFDITSIEKIQAPRFTLTKNADNTTYTLAVAEGVTTAAKGEFASTETVRSTPITLNTRLKGALLGAEPQDAVTTITLPSTLVTIEDYAFWNHQKVQGTLTIPSQVQSIGKYTFQYIGLKYLLDSSLVIAFAPDSQLTAIEADAFSFNSITSLILPEQLKTIEAFAFSNPNPTGKKMSSFTIPTKVTKIGAAAFINMIFSDNATLTIQSPSVTLEDQLFVNSPTKTVFTTVKLPQVVYDGYTRAELASRFGQVNAYQDLDGNAHTPKP